MRATSAHLCSVVAHKDSSLVALGSRKPEDFDVPRGAQCLHSMRKHASHVIKKLPRCKAYALLVACIQKRILWKQSKKHAPHSYDVIFGKQAPHTQMLHLMQAKRVESRFGSREPLACNSLSTAVLSGTLA